VLHRHERNFVTLKLEVARFFAISEQTYYPTRCNTYSEKCVLNWAVGVSRWRKKVYAVHNLVIGKPWNVPQTTLNRHPAIIVLAELKQNYGCHRFKIDHELEIVLTRWLITPDTGWYQQETDKFALRCDKRIDFRENHMVMRLDSDTIKLELFSLEFK